MKADHWFFGKFHDMQHFRVQTRLNVSGIERPLCLSDLSGFLECNSLLRLEYAAEPSQTSRRNRCVRLGCERNGQDGTRSLCDNPMAGLTLGPTGKHRAFCIANKLFRSRAEDQWLHSRLGLRSRNDQVDFVLFRELQNA